MKRSLLASLLLGVVHFTNASGASLDLHWDANPYNPAPTDSISYSLASPATSGSVYPDRYHGTATNLVGITDADLIDGTNGSLFTYCYEITQVYSAGSTVHYTLDSSAVTTATLDFLGGVVQVLSNGTNPYAWLNPINAYAIDATHSIPAANVAAAIQIGLWETRYDSAWDLAGGSFHASGLDAGTLNAITLFHDAVATSASLSSAYVTVLENPTAQDQITALRTVARQQVPEPGTLALIALGVPALFALRRKARVRG